MNAAELIAMLKLAGEARLSEPMSEHTSLGIGGPAEAMAFPKNTEELSNLQAKAFANGVPVFILGKGTNLLVLDGGIPGLVINLSKMNWIIKEHAGGDNFAVRSGAGTPLPKLASFCAEEGLSGLEFASGIPGTVGGAVYMNAGAYGYEIKDVLYKIKIVNEGGKIIELASGEIEKKYRHGGVPENTAVTEAWFKLMPGAAEEIKARASEYIGKRKATQPLSAKSAGSTFKNPPGKKAWQLIEGAGLKGLSVGGAAVSDKHANFFINTGKATAKDFIALMELVKTKVKEKTGIELEPEVRVVGKE
ncbi:MAG: UDP-N-acetylmuramate dehydrogenase [Nitrospirota bacterium]